jgi:hypothetical protein
MATFNVGDWVYYNNDESWLDGALGYIDKINHGMCVVEFVKDRQGNRLKTREVLSVERLIPANMMQPLADEAFRFLMDLALATRDFEWCRQLTEQYKRVAKARV